MIAFDGSDLTQAIADEEEAQRLVAQYMPAARSPLGLDPRVGRVSEMIAQHGLQKVQAAFRQAADSDNRGGLSVAFVQAILEHGGRPRAAPEAYQRRRYTQEEYAAMEVDLSAELQAMKS